MLFALQQLFKFVRCLIMHVKKGTSGDESIYFKEKTVATAVGKVTAEALVEEGIERIVVPQHERMGAMIVELGALF